ncbi:uncharacterized protein [Amphiura filiformis]|uniref:uncharacterized protein n=1 Tax=Amphiura filiformis TaxID=82378 RepID=UPI003B221180
MLANQFAVLSDIELSDLSDTDQSDKEENNESLPVTSQPVTSQPVTSQPVTSHLKNMNLKGSSGKRKRIFKQGYRKRKRKPTLNLDIGDNVVFESKGGEVGKTSLYVGKVKTKVDNDSYILESDACEGREYKITYQDNPKPMRELILVSSDLKKGGTVLVAWQITSGFVELIPGQIFEIVGEDYIWVKSLYGVCVKVHVDNCVKTTSEKQVINEVMDVNVSYEELNIVRLMLSATQCELDTVRSTYQNTLKQLQTKVKDCTKLEQQTKKLNELYTQALETTEQYRHDLLESTKTSQTVQTLETIITAQQKDLDELSKRILTTQQALADLREAYQAQTHEIEELRNENRQLKQLNQNHYEMRKTNGTVQGKKIGNKTRPSSFLPISLPNHENPSSSASKRTLHRRGEQLSQVLKLISARQNPSSADVIQTLAAFLRQNPDIAIPACKSAKINFATELNAKDAVDLKVLLRLPMTRMRDLRRFLSKFGVKLLPSDKHLYNEMKVRQYQSEDMVEVGVMNLRKTAHAMESPVAFFRVRNLEDYVISHIEKQMELGNTWSHDHFNKELWIKIGGDKGGTTTKLAFQFVNQNNSNSAAATNILSMFEATDTYCNMAHVFGNFTDQLAALQQKKTITINGIVHPLRIFYFGDTEYLCKSFGHMGCASSYPCLWCNIQLKLLRNTNGAPHCPMRLVNNKYVPNEDWPTSRTQESFQQDVANLLAEEEDEADRSRISGRDHHSISRRPLLPLPSDLLQIVPPSLHILLGLVVRYFKLIEKKCQHLDQGDMQDGVEQLDSSWRTISEIAKKAELELRENQDALNEELEILQSLQQAAKGRSVKGMTNDACCMPLCKLKNCSPNEVKKTDISWIRCIECGEGQTKGWFHSYCVGLSKEESESDENDDFVCPICSGEVSGPEDIIKLQQDRVNSHKALVNDKKTEYTSKKKALDDIYDEVVKNRGSFETNLNDTLKKIGVQRQAYHSQCFVGNHCKIILSKIELLLDVIPACVFKNNMLGLFKRLRSIFRLFKSEFLTDIEVRALCVRCWELGTWFPKKFPNESIPPKLHMLICHVPEFVQKWRTVGLLSEHGLESVHKDINSIERIYCTVRHSEEKMRLVIGNHQQRSNTDTASIQVSPKNKKTCYMFEKTGCKGRYVLRFKGSEERVCKKCGHVVNI